MTEERWYLGFLGNVDSSILDVKLQNNFTIEKMTVPEYKEFILIPEKNRITKKYVDDVISRDYPIVYENEIFFIKSSSENYFKNREYLHNAISLCKLFADGEIVIPIELETAIINEKKLIDVHSASSNLTHFYYKPMFSLKTSNIKELNECLKTTKIPLEKQWLNLSLENYNQSYKSFENNLSFLSLMISLEILFNPGIYELKYRISRNAAVFLGNFNGMDSKKVYSEISKLYDDRSKIVHTGRTDIIDDSDLLKLRGYVRESIRLMIINKMDKDDLLERLNILGFK